MKTVARKIEQVIVPEPHTEGAGVQLKRSIGTQKLNYLDPFLLFDHFGSKDPTDYKAGFPLHPHRGIETVTYMLTGSVSHKDTLGNSGTIGPGDVQWMTAGGGIMHEEMPQIRPEGNEGFQLWVNLPAKLKMMKPRYQDVRSEIIPEVKRKDGTRIRVITGETDGVKGPVSKIAANPIYLDVHLPANTTFVQRVERGHTAFSYIYKGQGNFGGSSVPSPRLVVWNDGDSIEVKTDKEPVNFLLVSGKPLNEPIARYGPFVMNTKAEIQQALQDLQEGTFVK